MERQAGEIPVRLSDGTVLAVPASLGSVTTYVLLEQEAWFEKEVAFLLRWLKPGMTVIDIGANLGVYALPSARAVGSGGRVYAYEPGSEARHFLERSRVRNGAENLTVLASALSDTSREAQLHTGTSSEFSSLTGSGPGENVHVTSLDEEDRDKNWTPDFVKIDAEGEEERILEGGRSFFARYSPLVMFEIKAGDAVNERLRAAFPARGYRLYRALPGIPLLVPDDPAESIDGFELNLFAAKPDRAAALAGEGLLLESVPAWTPDDAARTQALESLKAQIFAPAFSGLYSGVGLDPLYRDALAGFATWRSADIPLAERYAALDFAYRAMLKLCQTAPTTLSRLSTFARFAWEAGRRSYAAGAAKTFADLAVRGNFAITEPFWPADPRFDRIPPGPARTEWFLVSVLEQLEKTLHFSSLYGSSGVDLNWLSRRPFASTEMERRRVLVALRAGQRIAVPARLLQPAADHLNADIWREGLVPNTLVPA